MSCKNNDFGFKAKMLAGSFFAAVVSNPVVPLVVLGAIALAILFGVFFDSCQINWLGKQANTAANNQVNLNQNRQEIIKKSDAELKEINDEKLISNENVNRALANVNAARNSRNARNVDANELERLAAEQ